jgi:DNA-binding NarL/FixJ family response regulator
LELDAQALHDRLVAHTRAALGPEAFVTEWTRGWAMPPDEAVQDARDVAATVRARGRDGNLTARQREVLRLLVSGRKDRAIAETLFISPRTASKHVAAVLARLGVATRTEAVAVAVRDRLV